MLARMMGMLNREMPAKGSEDFNRLKKIASKGIQLRGRTLGIIGFGRIGQETARIGIGLGMNVLAADLVVNEAEIDLNVYKSQDVSLSVRVETTSMEEVLRKSDFITLHVPGGKQALIDAAAFEKMKDGVYLVNTSRGGLIAEDALLEAIASGKVAGAGLDVFVGEPTPRADLLNHPQITVSPHIGGSTQEAQSAIGMELAEQIISHFGH
jgi:D-3-phosphoglycerate dehydrogenase